MTNSKIPIDLQSLIDAGGPWQEARLIGNCLCLLGDCREILPVLPKVDLLLTDPPYGISGGSGLGKRRGKGDYQGSFEDTPQYLSSLVVPVICDLISKTGCVVVTPGNKNFSLYPQPQSFGVFYQPAAIGLQTFGNVDAQPIFYYGKNASRKVMGVPCSYVLTESPMGFGHPCEKPLKIWKKLLNNISLLGLTVLDPFAGSFTTGVACVQLDRQFIGIELEKKYYDIGCQRITEAVKQGQLFLSPQVKYEQSAMF